MFFERTASGLRFRLQVGPSLLLCVCLIIFLFFILFIHEQPFDSLLCSTSWFEMRPAGQDGQKQRLIFILRRCFMCSDGFLIESVAAGRRENEQQRQQVNGEVTNTPTNTRAGSGEVAPAA